MQKANFQAAVSNVDYKFMMIPLAFILLRIWSLILSVCPHPHIPVVVHQILKYLAVSTRPRSIIPWGGGEASFSNALTHYP